MKERLKLIFKMISCLAIAFYYILDDYLRLFEGHSIWGMQSISDYYRYYKPTNFKLNIFLSHGIVTLIVATFFIYVFYRDYKNNKDS